MRLGAKNMNPAKYFQNCIPSLINLELNLKTNIIRLVLHMQILVERLWQELYQMEVV